MAKRALLSVLVILLAVGAFFIHRDWYGLKMLLRLLRFPSPDDRVASLSGLFKRLPPSDRYVVLSIQGKMGTTWCGHITHQLLSHGKEVDPSRNQMWDTPYPEFWPMLTGRELYQEEEPVYWKREPFASYPDGPVTVRTHVSFSDLRTMNVSEEHGFRMVTSLRDPADTIVSMWRFFPGQLGMDYRVVPLASFFRMFNLLGAVDTMFKDIADVWKRRHHPKVHLIFFDNLKANLTGEIRRLSDFLTLSPPLTEKEFDTVVQQSTHKYMSSPEIAPRFNEGLPELVASLKRMLGVDDKDWYKDYEGVVRKDGGKTGEGGSMLPQDILDLLARKWQEHVQPVCDCSNFSEMLAKARHEMAP